MRGKGRADLKKHEEHPPQSRLLLMVKTPLPPAADTLEGIPPLPRDNSPSGLFLQRAIIKISVKIDCVSLLSHMHTQTCHRGVCTLQEASPQAGVQQTPALSKQRGLSLFFSKHKTKARLCFRKGPSAGSCTGIPCPEDFEVYLSFKIPLLS